MIYTFIKKAAVMTSLSMLVVSADMQGANLVWMAGDGDDSSPGTRFLPVKTIAGAIAKVDAGGQISALNPGDFGVATIAKGVTVDGTGTSLQVLDAVPNGAAITVAAAADDVVTLRNLDLNGLKIADVGIFFLSGKTLIIENCRISGFLASGIRADLSTAGNIIIRNCCISGSDIGVAIVGSDDGITATLDRVSIQDTSTGIEADIGSVAISNSIFARNGVAVVAGNTGQINCLNNLFEANGGAIMPAAGAAIRISNNDFYNNGNAIVNIGGEIATANNNRLSGNILNGSATSAITFQ